MAKAKTKKTKMEKAPTLTDLYDWASDGDERYQRLVIVALENLGCEHLGDMHRKRRGRDFPKWEAYYRGLLDYVGSLVGEYGIREDKAFRETLDEVNNVRDCIDQANLNW